MAITPDRASAPMEALYAERLDRYVTAMRNAVPDRIPIRPFAAEFTARYAGLTCQEVTHDFEKAFAAVRACAADFDWDAVVGNLVYVWTGLTQAIGLKYYAVPGIDLPPDTPFQYVEPPEGEAFMRADEYDALIEDPTGFLFNVWLPRVSSDVLCPGEPATFRNNLSFLKGGMAMMKYFDAFGRQNELLRRRSGTVSAIAGILKAPFDILADKLRGYVGLTKDMFSRPDKVLAACKALMPHLLRVAVSTADPRRQVPVGFWMHRGCVPFVSPAQFDSHYWPTLKPIVEELWARGHQTLFYAEGDWNHHLDRFTELPDASIVYHVDHADIFEVHRRIGHKFCLSGGIPNFLLSQRTPEEVRARCKKVIDGVAPDGGYIMDASAIVQGDARVENIRAMTEFTREHGVFYRGTTVSTPSASERHVITEPPIACCPTATTRERPSSAGSRLDSAGGSVTLRNQVVHCWCSRGPRRDARSHIRRFLEKPQRSSVAEVPSVTRDGKESAMRWQERYAEKRTTPAEAVRRIRRGQHVFISSGAAEPIGLVQALVEQADHFTDTQIVHLLTLGPAPYVEPKYEENFRHNAFFIGGNVRSAVHAGRADYTPVFLSQIPALMRSRRMPVDVALIQCSPPDDFGYVNLGVSVDIGLAAIESAHMVIAEINPNVPVIFGAGFLSFDRISAWVFNDAPLVILEPQPIDDVSMEIGRNVAALIEDGCTIQTGIGLIPDATLKALEGKKDLGLWTEMFSDGVVDLMEAGVINGKYKTIHPRKVSASFTFGSQRLYDYVHQNPAFTFHPSNYINDPIRVARQHKMVAINSALQVDLTGQVCADSLGTKFYSGIGGQVDFIRGASMCPGGRPIIALPSTARGGQVSRIAATLSEGAGVVTSRGDVRFVVTEYGSADLQGKSIRERALALISIAHPDFRSELLAAAKNQHYVFVDQIEPRAIYPRRFEKRVRTKKDVPVLLRPIRPTDEPKLQDLFYSLSDTTLYQRFQRVIKSVPHRELQYYLDVDYRANMALVGETCEEHRDAEIIGVAQYFLDQASGFADAAFVIRDEWQGQGLGTLMIRHLIDIARENGVKGFVADVLVSNGGMLHVFSNSGLEINSTLSGDVYQLKMPLSRSGRRASDAGRLKNA